MMVLGLAAMANTSNAQPCLNVQPCQIVQPTTGGIRPAAATPTACLEGRLKLLRIALGRPIVELERQELTQFAKSYRQLIQTFNAAGDDVQEALRQTGYAQAQLELAAAELQDLAGMEAQQAEVQARSANRQKRLSEQKAETQAALKTLHAGYQKQPKPQVIDQMALLVQRLNDLDKLVQSLTEAVQPLHDSKAMEKPFRTLDGEIQAEVQLAIEHARLMGQLVVEASHEMDGAPRLLASGIAIALRANRAFAENPPANARFARRVGPLPRTQ